LPGATSPGAQPELDPNAGDGDNEALTNIRSED
jgi:hypothetical protein